MSLDITVLRLLKYRERYDRLARSVPKNALQPVIVELLNDFGVFFREFDTAQRIEHGPFLTWFRGFRHPSMKDEGFGLYQAILEKAMEDVSPELEAGLMERLVAADTAARVTSLLERWSKGDEVDLYAELRQNVERFEQQVDRKVKNPQVLDPIEDLLKAEENDTGLHWRLPCLNRHIKPVRGGDFIIVAARPDKGKTSFCAAELTHMAAQLDQVYPGENRSILWFNNEGPGNKIIMRNFQAALGATVEELVQLSNTPSVDPKYKTLVRERYATALGGRAGALRVFDIHDMWNHEVEDIMRLYNPGVVLFDMVDNIKFGGEANNNGQRTDQLLEAMYQWARLMGVKHDCGVIATSQLSADADGVSYPTLPQLKDSKTGKQGAADVIITLGALNDPVLENSRYIGCTKNKKQRTGKRNSPNQEVFFDSQKSRYVEASA
ncbi:MAG: AAA family ATPase [Burkholderiales bacterium]|nr:AAA family ATPase [Burkholderiales bacterium]